MIGGMPDSQVDMLQAWLGHLSASVALLELWGRVSRE